MEVSEPTGLAVTGFGLWSYPTMAEFLGGEAAPTATLYCPVCFIMAFAVGRFSSKFESIEALVLDDSCVYLHPGGGSTVKCVDCGREVN
jgi:hypothetical protein